MASTTYNFDFSFYDYVSYGQPYEYQSTSITGSGYFTYDGTPSTVQLSDLTNFGVHAVDVYIYHVGFVGGNTSGFYAPFSSLETFSFDPSNPNSLSLTASEFPLAVTVPSSPQIDIGGQGPGTVFINIFGPVAALTDIYPVAAPEPSTVSLLTSAIFALVVLLLQSWFRRVIAGDRR
jgi:hypothetical protein